MPDQPLTAQDLRDALQMHARMTRRGSSYEDVAREIGSVVLAAGIVWAIIGAPVVPAVQEFLPDASDEMTADRALTSAVVALGFVIGISYIVGEVVAPAYPSSILTCRCGRSCACCASRPHRRPHVPGRQRAVSDIAAFCEEFRRAGDESGGGVAYIGAGSLEGVERSSNWTAFEDYEGVAFLAARAAQQRAGRHRPAADARVSQVVARHERALMRVALHWSLCRDDALDAYQRALEIYVRRIDSLDPATEINWLKVVVKHEALAVRRQRAEVLPVEDVDLDGHAAADQRPVDDLLAGRERVTRSAEALRRLKPDEARALMLKAQGLSYQEIADSLEWTFTKVNRCITEGRARFLKVYAEIEAGAECDRLAPTLAALVAGTASADALLDLRPHIRNCATCRATVREMHATRLGRLAALWPIPALLAPLRWLTGRFGDGAPVVESGPEGLVAGPDADPGQKLAPVDPSHVIAPLEAPPIPAIEQARPRVLDWTVQRAADGVSTIKQHTATAYSRAVDPTPLAGVRPGAAAAAIAGCLAIGGGSTYCVTQGVDPVGGLAQVVSPREQKRPEPGKKRQAPKRVRAVPVSTPAPTPVAIPTVEPPKPSPQPTAQATPSPTAEPTPPPIPEEEYEPLAPATAATTAPRASSASSLSPAPAPAGGPGEFDGP